MKIVLVIFVLSVQSSYLGNTEEDATDDVFDTVQFVATDRGAWRIKTYGMDQDVHTWSIGEAPEGIVELARANTEKHYGDVLSEGYIIETVDGIEGLRKELRERGLSDHLEVSPTGLLFWAPEGTRYRSKSTPRQ